MSRLSAPETEETNVAPVVVTSATPEAPRSSAPLSTKAKATLAGVGTFVVFGIAYGIGCSAHNEKDCNAMPRGFLNMMGLAAMGLKLGATGAYAVFAGANSVGAATVTASVANRAVIAEKGAIIAEKAKNLASQLYAAMFSGKKPANGGGLGATLLDVDANSVRSTRSVNGVGGDGSNPIMQTAAEPAPLGSPRQP